MATDYENKMLDLKSEEKTTISDSDKMYDDMISESTGGYDKLVDASKDYVDKQTKLQNEQTDFAIKKINQEKDQAKKDYLKEQTGAYTDWQKQSNPYGVNAEQMASMGMSDTGYSETSQVSMYNTYQNRVATARETYNKALLNYNNSITEAKLQNSSLLAEIAYQGLQDQLKLSIESMQYKNSLLTQKTTAQREIRNEYINRWKTLLDQMNTENSVVGKYISNTEDTGENLTVDMDSVLALGYGSISASELNYLVKTGVIEEYEENGKLKYKHIGPDITRSGDFVVGNGLGGKAL